jgi:hypothetical protein
MAVLRSSERISTAPSHDPRPIPTKAPGTGHRWQFSVASLLALMTVVAINLTLFRFNTLFAVAMTAFAAEVLFLAVADNFVRNANRRTWAVLTRAAWYLVGILLVALLALFAYLITRAM